MKKIFTLIVMAVMAFSASAQNTYGIYMDETTLAGTLMGVTEEAIGYTPGVTTAGDVKVTYTNGKDTKYIAELEKTFGSNFFLNAFNYASFQYRPYIANGAVSSTWALIDGGVLVCTGYKNGTDETAAGFIGSDADAASRWPEYENNDETQPKIDYFSKNLYEIAPDYWTGMTIEVPEGQALNVDEISVAIGGGNAFYWSVAVFNEAGELLYDSKVAQVQNNFNSGDVIKQGNFLGFSADITAAGVSEPLGGYNFMPKSWHSSAGYFDNFIGEAALPITLEKADKMKAAGWDPTNGKSPVRKFQPLPAGLKLTGKNTVRVYFGCKNSSIFGLPYLYIKGSLEYNVKAENTLSTWDGKFTVKSGNCNNFQNDITLPAEFGMEVTYYEAIDAYYVTTFLDENVGNLTYGGWPMTIAADNKSATINLKTGTGAAYIMSKDGLYYQAVDNQGAITTLTMTRNADGTISLSDFFVVRGEYGSTATPTNVAGYGQNVVTKQEEPKPVEWHGKYTLESNAFQVFDGSSDFVAQSDMVIEYDAKYGEYRLTEFLGYDVGALNYGGIYIVPSTTDPNVAHISLASAYIKTELPGVSYYKLVDGNGGSESLELKSYGNGTFLLSPFYVVKEKYSEEGVDTTYVAKYSQNIVTKKVYVNPDSSLEVTPDDPEGWNDLSRPHKLTIEGTYESPAGLDGMIEYAVEDSEEWLQLTEMLPSGSSFSDSLIAMFDATREKHVIRFRTRDNVGDTTLLPSIEYLDVSFHEYSGIVDKTYTGDSIYQDVYCADVEGLPIGTGKYSGNVNAGTATFYIEGVFPHTIGRKVCSFHINPAQ